MIFDVNSDPIRGSVGGQCDFGVALREFEAVLQQISDCAEQHFLVSTVDRKKFVEHLAA
jgi:hypothetical protein